MTATNSTESFYTSGEYWRSRLTSSSDYKVPLALRALAAANIELKPGLKAAEIGCGNGAFLFPLARALDAKFRAFTLCGFDISPLAIERATEMARESGDNRISFHLGSAANVKDRFDVVFLMDVVEHVTDPYEFLESTRAVAPLVVLHLPIEQSVAHNLLHKLTQSYNTYHHVHFFSRESMRLLLWETGFEILALRFTAASPEILHSQGDVVTKLFREIRYCSYRFSPYLSSVLFGGSVMIVMRPASNGRALNGHGK